jgi:hypothetical protein
MVGGSNGSGDDLLNEGGFAHGGVTEEDDLVLRMVLDEGGLLVVHG